MSSTSNLGLPLLMPSQAQKHVTVNEAIARLDGLCQCTIASISTATPPSDVAEGSVYGVPAGASDAWVGEDGQLAIYSNGGWVFVTPKIGWRGYISDLGATAVFDGAEWQANAMAISPGGAASLAQVIEFDHDITAGPSNDTSVVIPSHAIVFGVTARIRAAITGTASAWRLGVADSDNRYGSGIGVTAGSWVLGLSGQPVTYYADTPIRLTAEGGTFASGQVRLALHLYRVTLPRA